MVVTLSKSIEHLEGRIADFLKWAIEEDAFDSEECARIKEQINEEKWAIFEKRFGITSEASERHWISEFDAVSYNKCRVHIVPLVDPELKAVYWKYLEEAQNHKPTPP
jgi:hypothetical protein